MNRFPFETYHTQFPPKEHGLAKYDIYGAWYGGDVEALHSVWGGTVQAKQNNAFWNKDNKDTGLSRVHVPLASDIAQTSADMLFASVPDITIPEADESEGNGRAQEAYDRLIEIITESDLHSTLIEAGETASALGGVFVKPVWDADFVDFPLLTIVQADHAIPEFQWGILKAVTFWKVIKEEEDDQNPGEKKIWRLFERHCMEDKRAVLYTSIHCGKKDEIGDPVPFAEMPGYENLQERIDLGYESIMVRYIPNIRPNRLMRGSALGQSDLAGTETLLDAIDETYSSLMRDVRIARARLVIPEKFLDFDQTRDGYSVAHFDNEKAIYAPINADPMIDKDAKIMATQFTIRTEQHVATILDLIERVVIHAGYSPQTFGLKLEGAESGKALSIRERKTFTTRQKKWRYWATALEDLLHMLLYIDNVFLKNKTPFDFRPSVAISDSADRDTMVLAETMKVLYDAQSISIDTKVRMLHPEWDEEQIKAEIEMIKEEFGIGQQVDGLTSIDDAMDQTRLNADEFGSPASDEEIQEDEEEVLEEE